MDGKAAPPLAVSLLPPDDVAPPEPVLPPNADTEPPPASWSLVCPVSHAKAKTGVNASKKSGRATCGRRLRKDTEERFTTGMGMFNRKFAERQAARGVSAVAGPLNLEYRAASAIGVQELALF